VCNQGSIHKYGETNDHAALQALSNKLPMNQAFVLVIIFIPHALTMNDPWTSCRPFPAHAWAYYRRDHNDHFYMQNSDSFDQSGSSDPSRDELSFPDDSFSHLAAASMPAREAESENPFIMKTSPVWKQSSKRARVDIDVDADPFFQLGAGQDLYGLSALSSSIESELLHDRQGREETGDGLYDTKEAVSPAQLRPQVSLKEDAMAYRMRDEQNAGLSYPDYHSNWATANSSEGVNSPTLHYYNEAGQYLSPRYDSYPDTQSYHSGRHTPRQPSVAHDQRAIDSYTHDADASASSPSNNSEGSRASARSERSPASARSGHSLAADAGQVEAKLTPSTAAVENAGTPRAQEALLTWYDRLKELHAFKQQYGHTNVPQKYSPNPKLGVWVNKQRMEKKCYDDHGQTSMTHEKLEALASIGFIWAKRKGQHSWDTKYAELSEYKKINGDCKSP
jgi:hypothetical protein